MTSLYPGWRPKKSDILGDYVLKRVSPRACNHRLEGAYLTEKLVYEALCNLMTSPNPSLEGIA